jgi:ubiquinone/menaquinone biosynthesis C-methylase UbiE
MFVNEKRLDLLRTQIERGEFRHVTGRPVEAKLEAALSTSDGQFFYPVVEGILVLLPSLSIAGPGSAESIFGHELMSSTESVMHFYDEIGWKPSEEHDGHYQDAGRFEDLRPVSADYIHRCHLRLNKYIPRRGTYLLDVASGPVQYREYLTYSAGYDRRVCADISMRALKAARQKLGDKGIYIQCDITCLPLKDGSMDGFVSLHTIYHVPEDRQLTAFKELERVLSPGRTGVVVYSWGSHCRAMRYLTAYTPRQLLRRAVPTFLVRLLKKGFRSREPVKTTGHPSLSGAGQKAPGLYFRPHDYRWFRQEVSSVASWRVRVWRSVSVPFLRRYIRSGFLGRPFLAALFRIENVFPGFFGRYGQYPLMVFTKSRPGTAVD